MAMVSEGLVSLCPYAPMDGIFHLRIYCKKQRNVGIINIYAIYMYHWMWVFDGVCSDYDVVYIQ